MRATDLPDGLTVGGVHLPPERLHGLYAERLSLLMVSAFDTKDWTDHIIDRWVDMARDELERMRTKAQEVPQEGVS